MSSAFAITAAAAMQIQRAAVEQVDSAPLLRVAAKLGDNGDILYGMGFDDERAQDIKVASQGVTVLIAPPSLVYLSGASLDFVETAPGEFQFLFINPNQPAPLAQCSDASNSVGCTGCGGGNC